MTTRHCIRCGRSLPSGQDPSRPCAACLLDLGLEEARPRSAPPTPEELARDLPALEVLEQIGSGGAGTVYRARQRSLGREVALKVITGDAAEEPEFAERFTREARALASLSHPGIVAVHDFGRAGERHYLVMELVRGVSLRQAMRVGEIAPSQALEIVRQICDALQFAHQKGVVHRDIKPENLLLDEDGRVKIADFGLARILQPDVDELRLTSTEHRMGTPHYMAPEQLESPNAVDHRADIYSLGVVFYELLTGELPLGSFEPPSRKVAVDVRLDEVVLRSLAREPELRYQQAAEIKTGLEQLTRGTQPRPAPARREGGRSRSWIGLALVLAALLLVPLACSALLFLPGQDS